MMTIRFCAKYTHDLLQVTSGFKMAVFTPQYPPTIPTPENVLEECVNLGCDYALITPTFVEVSRVTILRFRRTVD